MTIQFSEFRDEHLPSIISLLNVEYKGDIEFVPYDEGRVTSHIRRWKINITVAQENGSLLGFIGTRPEERSEEDIIWLAVRQDKDQKTIENKLVDHVERKAKSDTISTGIDEGNPKIVDWINRGYALSPGWLRMSTKLDKLKQVPNVPEDVKLRSLRIDEEPELIQVMNTGFGWKRLEPGALNNWKTEDPPFNENWVQVAEASGQIVSAVVAKPDTDYNKHHRDKRGHLGPAATLSQFRGKHLASALTTRALNLLFENGMQSARLGTSEQNTASITLLRPLGFQVDSVRKVMRKKLKNTGAY